MVRAAGVLSCPDCGPQIVTGDGLVSVMSPQHPHVNHIQFPCSRCGVVRRVEASILPSRVTAAGGRILVLQWAQELDDPARRTTRPVFGADDVIDWHEALDACVSLREWET